MALVLTFGTGLFSFGTAFAGESQARNRYTYFASQAKKDGYEQIAAIFEETANQERGHAKRLFKFLEGGEVVPVFKESGAITSRPMRRVY
jgi:rubrerythrin